MKEGKHRLQSRHAFLEQEEIAEAEEMENSEMSDDKAGGEKSPSVSRSRLRKESIRGHPERKFERDSEITEPDRQNRKKRWSQPMQQKSRNATMKSQKLMKINGRLSGRD